MERVLLKVAWSMGFNLRVASDAEYIDRERAQKTYRTAATSWHLHCSSTMMPKTNYFQICQNQVLARRGKKPFVPFSNLSFSFFPPERIVEMGNESQKVHY